jgi:hypothetical protein
MPYTPAAKNLMLNALAGQAVFVSLHTAAPGTTGASEVVGGTYARKSITWAAAVNGSIDSSVVPVFDVPAGTTITHVGFATAVTAGSFLGSALVTSETFASAGTYSLTDADLDLNL